MRCETKLRQPAKSIGLERTNSNHQFDFEDFDYVWRNGVKVPVVHQMWLGGCRYKHFIEFYGTGPHNRCFYYEGKVMHQNCIKVFKDQIDDGHWCFYPVTGTESQMKEWIRNRKSGMEITDNGVANMIVSKQTWVQPRTIYRANKMLRNPELCLHETHYENICRDGQDFCPNCNQPIDDSRATVVSEVYNIKKGRSCGCNR